MRAGQIGVAMVACSLTSAAMAEADLPPLEPYQMVRSLQLAQDRIADGDQAALPMQKKMIDLIDERLSNMKAAEFEDGRNLDALMIYGMAGGNPRTFERVTGRLHLDEKQRDVADGILAYFRSDPGKASQYLASVSPDDETPEVGAFLALIKGTVRSFDHPQEGLALLDQARLLAPGSLVEEAALRRSITLATDTHDPARFLKASEQYVRRFLKSPYASHFADGFINGVIAMHERLDMARIKSIIDLMNHDQQTAVYLRIARKSAIQGHTVLAKFASSGAGNIDSAEDKGPDPRAGLYNALASVTSDSIGEMSERLANINPKDLSPRDARLLDAAKEVVKSVLAEPATLSPTTGDSRSEMNVGADTGTDDAPTPDMRPRAATAPAPSGHTHVQPHDNPSSADQPPPRPAAGPAIAVSRESGKNPPQPEVRVVRTERIAVPKSDQATLSPADDVQPLAERMAGETPSPEADPEMELVVETRKRLDDIDKLLEEGPK